MAARSFLPAYCAVAVGDAVLAARGNRRARRATKTLLMPLLAAYVADADAVDSTTGRLILGGLGLSWAGDVALLGEGDTPFTAGLGSFLAAHGCYLAAFTRHRQGGVRRAPWLAGAYVVAWAGLNAALASRTGRFRVPVIVYGTALLAMTLAALDTGRPAVAGGGALFLVSDSILALERFSAATIPRADGLVMLTYTAAQALIAHGMARAPTVRGG
jgi:uncharacterized membrane protein YhhN